MEPLSASITSLQRALRILLVTAVIHIALYFLEARSTFAELFVPPPFTSTARTGPFAKGADYVGYYAWLRSPLIDGDFNFDDEFGPTLALFPGATEAYPRNPAGHMSNPWPVGPAIVWSPAVATTHLILTSLGSRSPWPADGYSAPYQLAIGMTTLALAMLTLVLTYRIARYFASPKAAAIATALITLGTPYVAYGAVEVSLSHGPATAALTLFVYFWLRTFGSPRPARWVALGCLLGLTCLMRWQLATYAALPALEAVWLATRTGKWSKRIGIVGRLAVAGLMSVVVFTPQMVGRQIASGRPLGGLHSTGHNWFAPSLWTVLGSTDRSLFYWTPLALPAFASLVLLAVRSRRSAVVILTSAVVVQIYTVSALLGEQVYLGWSFGFRILTETCVLMAPGVAVLLDRASARTARRLALGGGVLVGWNLLLLGVYRHCIGGVDGGDPMAVLGWVVRYIGLRPLEALAMVGATGGLTYTLIGALRSAEWNEGGLVPDQKSRRQAA
jgi:hypothetical protein